MSCLATVLCAFLVVCCAAVEARAALTLAHDPYFTEQSSSSLLDSNTSPRTIGTIKIADDYCNSRCIQRFNYCKYSGGSTDHCLYQLVHCRANC